MKKAKRLAVLLLASVLILTTVIQGFAADTVTTVIGEEVTASAGDASDSPEKDVFVDISGVDVGESITDPLLETYIEESVDEEYTDTADKKLVNYILVKQTFFDANLVNEDDTVSSVMTAIEEGNEETAAEALEKYVMQTSGYVAVYEMDEDSDYFVAYVDNSSSSETREAVFAVNNNDGETVDGCIYDAETGIAYIPKDLLVNDADEQVLLYLQVQLMQLIDLGENTKTVTVSVDDGEDFLSSTEQEVDFYDTETTVTVGEDLTIVSVAADGAPVSEDYYSYDLSSGELTIAQSPTSVQSVSVTVDKDSSGLLDSLISAVSNAFSETAYALSSWDEMSYFARNIDIGSMSVGDVIDCTVGYSYSGSYKYSSTVYGAKAESETYAAELISAVDSGTAVNISHIASLSSALYTCSAIQLNTGSLPSINAGLGSITSTMVLECAHIDTRLGSASNGATEVDARIRLLATGTDSSGTSYAVFGIITQMTHTQSSIGIFKVGIVTGGKAYVQKQPSDATKVAGNSNYSLANAKYQVFKYKSDAEAAQTGSDSNNTARIATLTTDSNGKTQTVELSAGTYYIREIVASKGYNLDTEIHEVVVTNGQTSKVESTEPYDTGDLKIIKYSDNTSVTSGNSNYSLKNAEFTVYSDADFKTIVGTVKMDQYDSSGDYYFGTLKDLLFGTYYIKESTAPESGYAIDEKERSVTIGVNGDTTAFWDRPVTITVNLVKSADTSGIPTGSLTLDPEEILTGSDSYSLAGAIYGLYSASACTASVLIATASTDVNGNATFDTDNLAMGTYYVKEIQAPEGYALDETVYTVDATKDSDDLYTVSATNKAIEISAVDPVIGGSIELYKVSADPSITNTVTGKKYYSLAGAVYGVYYDSGCSFLLTTITTDRNGYGKTDDDVVLPYATYYVQEISPSPYYDLDETIYSVTVSADIPAAVVKSEEPPQTRTLIISKGPFSMLETGTAFDADIPAKATSVVFTETDNIPVGYTVDNGKLTDVSYVRDGGIVAWLDGTTWYVAAAEENQPIYFNYDSAYMFAQSGAGTGTYNTNGHSVVSVDFGEGVIDTTFTTDISGMFSNAWSVKTVAGLDEIDTSNVTNMAAVFHHAYSLSGTIDLSNWETSNVKSMENFMDNCWNVEDLTLGDGWDTSNVTDFYGFVAITSFPDDTYQNIVNTLEIDSAADLGMMFAQTSSDDLDKYGSTYVGDTTISSNLISLDLSGWNLESNTTITDMQQMFRGAVKLGDITGMYIPENVVSTYKMFTSCYYLGADAFSATEIKVLTTALRDCEQMFYNAAIFDRANNTNIIVTITCNSAGKFAAEAMFAEAKTGENSYGNGNDYSGYTNLIELSDSATAAIESAEPSVLLASAASFFSAAAGMFRQMVSGISDGSFYASATGLFKSVDANAADSDDETSLQDALYSAFKDRECTDLYGEFEYWTSVYDDDNSETAYYILTGVPYGLSLWVKEVKPSTGYGLDANVYEFEESTEASASAVSKEPPGPEDASITIHKTFSGTVNENYSLEKIVYRVYTDENCTEGKELYIDGEIAELELTAGGVSNTVTIPDLEEDLEYKYYIKEYSVPPESGAKLDTTIYPVTLYAKEYKNIEVLTLKDEPVYGELEITKSSAGTSGASYEGATYGIYTEYTDEDNYVLWDTMTTGSDSKATKEDVPIGTYYIREIQAPTGYELDTTMVYQAVVAMDDNGEAYTTYSIAGESETYESLTVYDDEVYGSIDIYKYSADSSITDGNDSYSLKGAEFTVYESDGMTVYTTLTTDENGYASVTDVPLGTYYVMETEASRGYEITGEVREVVLKYTDVYNGKTYSVPWPETPTSITVTVVKSSADPGATDGNENYTLEGARFGVYKDADCSDESLADTFTTDANGYGESKALANGTYYLKEIQAPDGYVPDETIYKVEAADDSVSYTSMTTGESGSSILSGNSLSIPEEIETVKFRLYKESAQSDLTDHLDAYSLAGAVYGVYMSEEDAENDVVGDDGTGTLAIGYLMTDEEGITEYLTGLPYGTCYVKETKAPEGYETDENIYTVEMTRDTADADYAVELSVSDTPSYGGSLEIYKKAIPAQVLSEFVFPENTVEDAQFMVQYYDAQYASVEEIDEVGASPSRIWYIHVVSEGNGVYVAKLSDETDEDGNYIYLQADISDELYYDTDGNVIIPLGTVTIQESMSATGYTMDGSWYDADGNEILECDEDGNVTEDEDGTAKSVEAVLINITEDTGTGTVTFTKDDQEDVPPCSVTLIKKDSAGNVLSGVTFILYMYDKNLDEWITIGEAATDEEGKAVFEDLLYGYSYRITETGTVDGMTLLAEPIEFDLPMAVDAAVVESLDDVDMSTAYLSADGTYYNFCDITYTVTNSAEFHLPEAGSSAVLPVVFAIGLGIAVFGLILIVRRRRAPIG